jgi:hypothetical protein
MEESSWLLLSTRRRLHKNEVPTKDVGERIKKNSVEDLRSDPTGSLDENGRKKALFFLSDPTWRIFSVRLMGTSPPTELVPLTGGLRNSCFFHENRQSTPANTICSSTTADMPVTTSLASSGIMEEKQSPDCE